MRYAIYHAPSPGTPLHRLGSSWLGRDALTGEALAQPDVRGIAQLTADPRRYGFHATLKPPFALREGVEPEALMRGCAALAASITSFRVRLQLSLLDGFLALVPEGESAPLSLLAERCVRELDGFRKPPAEDELARRRKAPLTARQNASLQRWGYPYVLDDFRFHMTLTERLDPAEAARVSEAAATHFASELVGPVLIDGITLFTEKAPGMPFLAVRHFSFNPSSAEAAA